MKTHERLRLAPIVEAILNIQTELPSEVGVDELGTLGEKLGRDFPNREVRNSWTSQFESRGDRQPAATTSGGPVGYLFRSIDGRRVVQARLDGFSYSRLRPYTGWDEMRAEARAAWPAFIETARPTKATRLSLRYINRVEIPLPISDFKEYLRTSPEIAPGLPQGLSSFFFRVVVPDADSGATAIITETIEEGGGTVDCLPLLFDVDVIRPVSLAPKSDQIWLAFDGLRTYKNRVFFESFTDKARELFK